MQNEQPLISVIVPVYNVQEYLEQCVESLICQTYKNIEIILVDDGSTDNSGLLCDRYAERYDNIFVYHKINGGLSSARNYGIDKAKGDYLSFIDSDDFVSCDFLECMAESMIDYKADVVMCNYSMYYNENNVKDVLIKEKNTVVYHDLEADRRLYLEFAAWNKLYSKELFNNIRYPDGKLYEDARTMYKIANSIERLVVIPKSMLYYRQRKTGIMGTFSTKNYLDRVNVWSEIYEFEKNKFSDEELQNILQRKNKLVLELISTIFKNQFLSFDRKLMKKLLGELHNPVNLNPKERIMMFLLKIFTIS